MPNPLPLDEDRARRIIAEHLGAPLPLVLDIVAFADLGADSLDQVELAMALEQEFDLSISDDQAHRCRTVGDAMALLRRLSRAGREMAVLSGPQGV